MKNIYINTIFGAIVALAGMIPGMMHAESVTYYAGSQPITITNNNVNNNTNTNTYSPAVVHGGGSDVHAIAQANLPTLYVAPKTAVQTTGRMSYHLVQEFNCGATVAVADTYGAKPACTLIPSVTASGAIQLEWRTYGASVAFIDAGVGHVSTIAGKRIVTPTKDTFYNMTVLNDAGMASTCGAKINVANSQSTSYSQTIVSGGQVAGVANANGNTNTNTNINTTTDTATGTDATSNTNTGVIVASSDDTSTSTSIFAKAFKTVALPIGIVFLLLIILLVFMMSRVKAAK
jgi:hypothetical protein